MTRILPDEFVKRLHADGLDDVVQALATTEPVVAMRLNPRKRFSPPSGSRAVEWWSNGVILPERPLFTLDPALHQGRYYVQDPASMFFAPLIAWLISDISHPIALADLCAAPGGKTTAAIDSLPDSAFVLANEVDPKRAAVLAENLTKWGAPDARVVTNEAVGSLAALMAGAFDVVIADVPCSGEGMMRKEASAIKQWSPRLVEQCSALQREIATDSWRMVMPGGYMIYSTCALNRHENEDNVTWLTQTLGAEPVQLPAELTSRGGITPALDGVAGWRFMPGRSESEGLFVAVLHKPDIGRHQSLCNPGKKGMRTLKMGATTSVFPSQWIKAADAVLNPRNKIRLADIPGVALTDGNSPAQALAMTCNASLRGNCPTVDIDLDTALEYLRRQAITLPGQTPKGITIVTYDNLPLGFVKNLGARANNLYPKEWRIRI